jgi:hypothetical protein
MSYTFNKTVDIDERLKDAFGRLTVSELTNILEVKHVYDKAPLVVDELTNGTGNTVWDSDHSDVEMNVSNNGDFVIRQTKGRGVYSPGKSGLVNATFMNFHLQNNVIKRVGYFSSSTAYPYSASFDGMFLESNGVTDTISFQIWRNGIEIFNCPLSGWDSSVVDPNTIDFEQDQLLTIDFQWLGAGRVRFGLTLDEGEIIFATHVSANHVQDPYIKNPNQPIRYEIRQNGSGTGGTLHQLCANYSIEGSHNILNKSVSIGNTTERNLAVPGVKYALLGYRHGSNYSGSNIVLESLFSLNQITGTDYLITVEMNPGITGGTASWTAVTNTPVEVAQGNGSLTVNSTPLTIKSYIGKGNAATTDNYSLVDNLIVPGTCINGVRDEVWICVTPLIVSGNTKIRAITANLNFYD